MDLPNNIMHAAQRRLAELFGDTEFTVIRSDTDVHPTSGRPLHLVSAVPAVSPNARPTDVLLDDEGRPVELAAAERPHFVPGLAAPPPELLEAVKVRVNPRVNDLTLDKCDVFKETVTVTVPKSAAVADADIYFLSDNTGSMGTIIASVQAGASAILSALPASLQYGVGRYWDFPGALSAVFENQQPITPSKAAVQTAINAWNAAGGGDTSEGQFYALDQIAQPPGGAIGWRPGVKRILVWFGDAPGHEDICPAISGLPFTINEASATSRLQAEKIQVLAISTNTGPGLDGDPTADAGDYVGACNPPKGTPGQATRIAAATSGIHVAGIDATTIVKTIIDELIALLAIGNLHLEASGAIAPFVTSITPAAGYGPLASDSEHVLPFEVSFSVDSLDCVTRDRTFTGSLDVVADGVVVGGKPTKITVPACKFVYAVKFVCGVQGECDCGCATVRPGTYATEINILNSQCKDANIEKRVIPMVFAGAVTGREPHVAGARATDRIVLPPNSATMDDCCRIGELLYGGNASPMPLSIGYLQIVSDQELSVTAVYTVSDPKGNGVSMDVQQIAHTLS